MVASKTISTLSSHISKEMWQYDGLALARRGNETYINEASIVGGTTLMTKALGALNKATYYLNDHLGTTLASIDVQESKALQTTAFGEPRKSSDLNLKSGNAFFTGKPYDSELGAYVYAYRNYRADLGRWTTADPAGDPDGTNNYRYAATPNNGFDRLGLANNTEAIWMHYKDPDGGVSMQPDIEKYARAFIGSAPYDGSKSNGVKDGGELRDAIGQDQTGRLKVYNPAQTCQQLAMMLLLEGNPKIYVGLHGYQMLYPQANHVINNIRFIRGGSYMNPEGMSDDHFIAAIRLFLPDGKKHLVVSNFNYDGCFIEGQMDGKRINPHDGGKGIEIGVHDLFQPKYMPPGDIRSWYYYNKGLVDEFRGIFSLSTLHHLE